MNPEDEKKEPQPEKTQPESTESKLNRLRAAGGKINTQSNDSGGLIICGTSPPSPPQKADPAVGTTPPPNPAPANMQPESIESKLNRLRAAGITVVTQSQDFGGLVICGTDPPSAKSKADAPEDSKEKNNDIAK